MPVFCFRQLRSQGIEVGERPFLEEIPVPEQGISNRFQTELPSVEVAVADRRGPGRGIDRNQGVPDEAAEAELEVAAGVGVLLELELHDQIVLGSRGRGVGGSLIPGVEFRGRQVGIGEVPQDVGEGEDLGLRIEGVEHREADLGVQVGDLVVDSWMISSRSRIAASAKRVITAFGNVM